MPMGQLTQVLRDVQREPDDRLLVGPQTVDDAGRRAIPLERFIGWREAASHAEAGL